MSHDSCLTLRLNCLARIRKYRRWTAHADRAETQRDRMCVRVFVCAIILVCCSGCVYGWHMCTFAPFAIPRAACIMHFRSKRRHSMSNTQHKHDPLTWSSAPCSLSLSIVRSRFVCVRVCVCECTLWARTECICELLSVHLIVVWNERYALQLALAQWDIGCLVMIHSPCPTKRPYARIYTHFLSLSAVHAYQKYSSRINFRSEEIGIESTKIRRFNCARQFSFSFRSFSGRVSGTDEW